MAKVKIAVIGNGSFATALVKVLTDNEHPVTWWMRSEESLQHISTHQHNPHYLSQVYFNTALLHLTNDIQGAVQDATYVLLAVPSAFLHQALQQLSTDALQGKKIISAIKGMTPESNLLINEYLQHQYNVANTDYCCITGPCHAEEIAAEKLSYLTFGSESEALSIAVASYFDTHYLRTVINSDVYGIQYAAILKNIYALGAGVAHGLDYGDNFLSVYNTNCFAEMKHFMQSIAAHNQQLNTPHHYITSAYLGDLLVTSYSLHSRNRRFGNMLGKGYSVAAAKLELNMVAEGYYAAKCIKEIAESIACHMPICNALHNILWQNASAKKSFTEIETLLK